MKVKENERERWKIEDRPPLQPTHSAHTHTYRVVRGSPAVHTDHNKEKKERS